MWKRILTGSLIGKAKKKAAAKKKKAATKKKKAAKSASAGTRDPVKKKGTYRF
jgi:hypothetical protein